jgi:hypothetical protein
MDNSSIQKIQKDFKKSKAIIIKSDDTSTHIKENYGNKYLDDISDSDIDESMSYRKRNNNVINKLPEKNNSNIKPKMDGDNMSIKSLSVKKAPLRSTIKDNIKILFQGLLFLHLTLFCIYLMDSFPYMQIILYLIKK